MITLRHAGSMVLAGLLLSGAGCNSENGVGLLQGVLDVPQCTFPNGQAKSLANEANFRANWNYFLAEPFDSTTPRFPANQLNIRMQSSSGGWEFADTLFFWVLDSYAAVRCMRGRVDEHGLDDWDPDTCDRSPTSLGPSGEGRSLIGTERELITSHFVLQNSCPDAQISSDALGDCVGGTCPDVTVCPGRGSWVAFSRFGAPPSDLTKAVSTDFKVGNGEPIEASAFHVELCDASTVEDQQMGVVPVTKPAIRGSLDGSFSFKLQPNFR